jgi:hypothetical protein
MSRLLSSALSTAVLLLAAFAAPAMAQDIFQEGQTITVELMNGDKLTGILEDADGPRLVILHDVFGRMEIPRAAIKPSAPAPVEVVEPWSGAFDLALTGTNGNSENQNFRTSFDAKHDYEDGIDTFTLWYRRATSDGDATEEKGFGQARHEWKLTDTKWRPFVQASLETDKFTSYSSRAAVAAGAAYPCLVGDVHNLTGRVGAGVSHKYNIDDPSIDATSYEALLGFDWMWTLSKVSSFSWTTDVYPSVNEAGEFRSVSRIALDTKLDEAEAWFIRLGLDHTHDSDAGIARANDYGYYLGLGRKF